MTVSNYIMPLILGIFGLGCIFSKKDVQSGFISGAKEGITGSFSLIPILVLLMTSVAMFNASGACDMLCSLIGGLTEKLGIPSELTPLIIIRPLSGSGSTALLSEVLEKYGADSFIGNCASIMCASSDTVFYVTALYMSSAGVKNTRYTIPCAIAVMLLGTLLSCLLARFLI